MSWKSHFDKGLSCSRASQFEDALEHFTLVCKSLSYLWMSSLLPQAITEAPTRPITYDSRAFVYSKLGMVKEALNDARKVIELAPEKWQGYARAARLFALTPKHKAAATMADVALARLGDSENKSRVEMQAIREQCKLALADRGRRSCYHFGLLPVELVREVFFLTSHNTQKTAMVCSHVSRSWRTIALADPRLWQSFLSYGTAFQSHVKEWVVRSRGRIETICLDFRLQKSPHYLYSDHLWTGLQWDTVQKFHYLGADPSALQVLENARNLSEITLSRHGLSTSAKLEIDESVTRSWKLRSLTLQHFGSVKIQPSTLTQLTKLEMIFTSIAGIDWFSVIAANLGLQTLILADEYLTPSLSPPPDGPSVSLPELRHVDLRGLASTFFLHFSIPAVSTLILASLPNTMNKILENAAQYTDGSLRFLHIQSGSKFEYNTFIDLLKKSPLLETLNIIGYSNGIVSKVLETLASDCLQIGVDAMLCPALESLDVSRTDVASGPITRIIKSRLQEAESTPHTDVRRHRCKIKTLIMNECERVDSQILPWLKCEVDQVQCTYMKKKDAKKRI